MADYDIPESQRYFDWFDSCIVDGYLHDIEMVSDAIKFIEEASGKIYVRPDSYHIFKPQVGDVIIDAIGQTLKQGNMNKAECSVLVREGVCKIILRHNKPFFTPKTGDE
ncbi:MAG: hypothetical protein V3V81_07545 [Candidatus Bathyarchaeia archaeon]